MTGANIQIIWVASSASFDDITRWCVTFDLLVVVLVINYTCN